MDNQATGSTQKGEEIKREIEQTKSLSAKYCVLYLPLVVVISSVVVVQALQSSPVLPWLAQVATGGAPPKLTTAPMVQLDTGNKYYNIMIDHMVANFRKSINKAIERNLNNKRSANVKPVTINTPNNKRITMRDLRLEGLDAAKVGDVFVNKKSMKLNVIFGFKNLRISGTCSDNQRPVSIKLIEASNWNTTWSANVLPMIGREHFDMKRVFTNHYHHKLTTNLKDCDVHGAVQDQLKAALIERIKTAIDANLVEIMESVMIKGDQGEDSNLSASSTNVSPPRDLGAIISKEASNWRSQVNTNKQLKRVLKRTKRQTPCQQGEELDDYVDQLFRFGTRIVRAMEPVTLPNATIELPDYSLKIFLYEGKGTRAYKFRRTKGAWVYCSNETVSLGLTVELEELRVAYKYRVISGYRLLFDGDLEAKLSPKVQIQFSQAVQPEDSEDPVMQRVDRIRVFRLGRVTVLIRGLGNLTQSLSMMINSYLNDNQEELQPTFRMVEGDAVKMINRLLANVTVPLLSVV